MASGACLVFHLPAIAHRPADTGPARRYAAAARIPTADGAPAASTPAPVPPHSRMSHSRVNQTPRSTSDAPRTDRGLGATALRVPTSAALSDRTLAVRDSHSHSLACCAMCAAPPPGPAVEPGSLGRTPAGDLLQDATRQPAAGSHFLRRPGHPEETSRDVPSIRSCLSVASHHQPSPCAASPTVAALSYPRLAAPLSCLTAETATLRLAIPALICCLSHGCQRHCSKGPVRHCLR